MQVFEVSSQWLGAAQEMQTPWVLMYGAVVGQTQLRVVSSKTKVEGQQAKSETSWFYSSWLIVRADELMIRAIRNIPVGYFIEGINKDYWVKLNLIKYPTSKSYSNIVQLFPFVIKVWYFPISRSFFTNPALIRTPTLRFLNNKVQTRL